MVADIAPQRRVIGDSGPLGIWSPFVAQSPLHPMTDDFEGDELDEKWTLWNPGGNIAIVKDTRGGIRIDAPSQVSGARVGGFLQPAPGVQKYCVTAAMRQSGSMQGVQDAMLVMGDDLIANPSTSAFLTFGKEYTGTPTADTWYHAWAAYNNYTNGPRGAGGFGFPAQLYRFFVDLTTDTNPSGPTFRQLMAEDGRDFVAYGDPVLLGGFTPDSFGIANHNGGTHYPNSVRALLFRVDETDDPFLPCGGMI